MKKLCTLLLLIISFQFGISQPKLSQNSEISLLTCAPGNEIYSLFGHSAMRVKDDSLQFDIVFNYGLFSYHSDNFIYHFTKGETYYRLGIQKYSRFLKSYERGSRPVFENTLNLTQDEKQQMFEYLHVNSLPENRVYLYKFFSDNCATRLRDVVETVLGPKLEWKSVNDSYVSLPESHWKKDTIAWCEDKWDRLTFRNLIYLYIDKSPWSNFGINMALGQPTDTLAGKYASMFAPDFLMNSFENARISRNGTYVPLVHKSKLVVDMPLQAPTKEFPLSPTQVFSILLILVSIVSVYEFKKNIQLYIIDFILFFIAGLLGILLLFISHFSIHEFVQNNFDIIWASPLHFIFALLLPIKRIRKYTLLYFYFVFLSLIILVLAWPILPENLNESCLLIISIFLVRSFIGIRLLWQEKTA